MSRKDILTIRTVPSTNDTLKRIGGYMEGILGTEFTNGQILEMLLRDTEQTYQKIYLESQFFHHRTEQGWVMSEAGLQQFVERIDRAEAYMDGMSGGYLKATQIVLLVLGFDEDWVNGPLWSALQERYLQMETTGK